MVPWLEGLVRGPVAGAGPGQCGGQTMLILLLIALGVDLAGVVVFAVFVFGAQAVAQTAARRIRRGDPGAGRRGRGPEPEMEAGFGPLGPRRSGVEQGAVHVPQ
jgi:hypothetical protein